MKITSQGQGLERRVQITVDRKDLPSDEDIDKKLLPVVLTPEELEDYVKKHWPVADEAILKVDPAKVEVAVAHVKEKLARVPLREGHCDCEDPHCPHKGPISPLELWTIAAGAPETRDFNFEAWRPFEYPIIRHQLAERQQLLLAASCVEGDRLNAMRCMIDYELKMEEGPIRIDFTRYFDVVEAIYFHDQIPSQFKVCSNDMAMRFVSAGRYNFIGFALRSAYCLSSIKIKRREKRPSKIGFIGWNFNDADIVKKLQMGEVLSSFIDGDQTFYFIYRQQGGLWTRDQRKTK